MSLVYLMLAAMGAQVSTVLAKAHDPIELVHLPPSAGVEGVAATADNGPTPRVAALPDRAAGPDMVAILATVIAAILALGCVPVRRLLPAAFVAVLGVGRWHRSVVLHL